ncbi:MAG: NAD-dependent DNA ligase LigA [Patescibacteria group bacterium]
MNKEEAKLRIQKLRKEIQHHRYLYHVLDRQEISDAALDSLKHELVRLEQSYPDLITAESPTQRVGGKPLGKFEKVDHATRMLSLNDVFSAEEVAEWEARIMKLIGKKPAYYAELKVDGLALSLVYMDGLLTRAATRGDGRVGENVTVNARTIEAIPLRLRRSERIKHAGVIEVRGEVYMLKKHFDELNRKQKERGEQLFANPRNAAAGSVRQLDSAVTASRKLSFIAYDLITESGFSKHSQEHEVLADLGFNSGIRYNKICRTLDEVGVYHQQTMKQRNALAFWVDGIVVSVDDNELYKQLGTVGKAPRGAIAYKYPAEQATTIVEDIQVQVGRTGALTPVAHLKPVSIAGSTVSRATLHNIDEIERLGVRIGDTVILEKAGDIIPDIVEVLPKLRNGKEKKFSMPKKCPVCGSAVQRKQGEVASYCSNKNCYAQQHEGLRHFISKKAFDIDGLGPKVLEQLFKADLVKSAPDLFDLTENDLRPLERFADKSAENLVAAIRHSKKVSLSRFIFALGIRHVGEETALALATAYKSIGALSRASKIQLEKIPDIGATVAQSIVDFFNDNEKLKFIRELTERVRIIHAPPVSLVSGHVLSGKRVVISGTFQFAGREEIKEKLRSAGAKVSSSLSQNTDYFFVGKDPGESKIKKAKELGIHESTESELRRLVGETSSIQ